MRAVSHGDLALAFRDARALPPSKIGTDSDTKPRQVRDGENSPAGVTSCGSNDAVAVGTQSRQLSSKTRIGGVDLRGEQLHVGAIR